MFVITRLESERVLVSMEIKSVELANNEFKPVTALGEHVLLCNRYFYIILISSFL